MNCFFIISTNIHYPGFAMIRKYVEGLTGGVSDEPDS